MLSMQGQDEFRGLVHKKADWVSSDSFKETHLIKRYDFVEPNLIIGENDFSE